MVYHLRSHPSVSSSFGSHHLSNCFFSCKSEINKLHILLVCRKQQIICTFSFIKLYTHAPKGTKTTITMITCSSQIGNTHTLGERQSTSCSSQISLTTITWYSWSSLYQTLMYSNSIKYYLQNHFVIHTKSVPWQQ